MELLYRIIYSPVINKTLRALIFPFRKLLPTGAWLPPSGSVEFTLDNGKTITMFTNQTSFVTWNIAWKGYKSYEYTPIFEALAPKINVFFDVGSNTGLYSLILAGCNPNAKAWAFEPSPGPFEYLSRNIAANGFNGRIHPVKTALSSTEGEAEFVSAFSPKYTYLKEATLGGSGHLSGARNNTSSLTFQVKTETLDQFVERNQISSIDLMKLDTEETEHLIIGSGLETLKKFEPILICEVFSVEMAIALGDLLKPLGYKPYQSKKTHLEAINEVEFQSGEIPDCFFVTDSRLHLISQFVKKA
jgi:FkbM family methyltransferase